MSAPSKAYLRERLSLMCMSFLNSSFSADRRGLESVMILRLFCRRQRVHGVQSPGHVRERHRQLLHG